MATGQATVTIQLVGGITADRIMDSLVGVLGFTAGMTATQLDDLLHAAAVALREDEDFMRRLRALIDPATPQSAHVQAAAQALDIATILKIIAAIKTLLDLISQIKGGGGLGGLLPPPTAPHAGYTPNTQERC